MVLFQGDYDYFSEETPGCGKGKTSFWMCGILICRDLFCMTWDKTNEQCFIQHNQVVNRERPFTVVMTSHGWDFFVLLVLNCYLWHYLKCLYLQPYKVWTKMNVCQHPNLTCGGMMVISAAMSVKTPLPRRHASVTPRCVMPNHFSSTLNPPPPPLISCTCRNSPSQPALEYALSRNGWPWSQNSPNSISITHQHPSG